MKVTTQIMLDLDDAIQYIMDQEDMTYNEVENLLPSWAYEDNMVLAAAGGNSDTAPFHHIRDWLIDNNIDRVWLYQDT